jgi:hypothetical protein
MHGSTLTFGAAHKISVSTKLRLSARCWPVAVRMRRDIAPVAVLGCRLPNSPSIPFELSTVDSWPSLKERGDG